MTVYMKNDIKGLRSLRSDLRRGRQQLQSSYRRLSSGFKVSGGAEDVDAELTNALRSRINRYAAAERMTNRAIMHARAAASGLGEIGEAVERMREIANQSADARLTLTDREQLDQEFQNLKAEIVRLNDDAGLQDPRMMYAGGSLDFQVPQSSSVEDRMNVDFSGVTLTLLGLQDASVVESGEGDQLPTSSTFDKAETLVADRQEHAGKLLERLRRAVTGTRAINGNLRAANIQDIDLSEAEQQSVLTRAKVLLRSGTSVLAQANQGSGVVLNLLH